MSGRTATRLGPGGEGTDPGRRPLPGRPCSAPPFLAGPQPAMGLRRPCGCGKPGRERTAAAGFAAADVPLTRDVGSQQRPGPRSFPRVDGPRPDRCGTSTLGGKVEAWTSTTARRATATTVWVAGGRDRPGAQGRRWVLNAAATAGVAAGGRPSGGAGREARFGVGRQPGAGAAGRTPMRHGTRATVAEHAQLPVAEWWPTATATGAVAALARYAEVMRRQFAPAGRLSASCGCHAACGVGECGAGLAAWQVVQPQGVDGAGGAGEPAGEPGGVRSGDGGTAGDRRQRPTRTR